MNEGNSADAASASMKLLQMTAAAWVGQAVYVAAKLSIADLLENGPKAPAVLAEATKTHAGNLLRLLRMLASVGVFAEEEDGRFALTPIADSLRTNAAVSLRAFAIMQGEDWNWRAWGYLLRTVQTGEPAFAHVHGINVYQYLREHPEAAAVFDAAITDRARQENAAVVAAYDWPEGTIIDVGGGQGSLLAAILAQTPKASGIVFEVPHVAAAAANLIEVCGLAGRCRSEPGDFFERVPAATSIC
jgi:O-methyltransferase